MRHFLLESDLVLPKAITPLGYKQYDNGDILEVEFWNDSERINLTNEKVLAFFELIDGVIVQKTCEIKNGNAIATLDNNILSKPGQIECEFTIYKGTTPGAEETTTKTIIIEVSKSIDRINSITSAPHWDIVQEMLNKNDIIDEKIKELEAKKNEAIATVTKIKDETIVQLNTTTEEVKTLKKETIEESIKIKDDAIKALDQIKTDSIKELNNIKDIANVDLNKVKADTILEVNRVAQEAIAAINNYNLKDISDKLNSHVDNTEIHVTKDIKDSIDKNTKDIDNLKQDLKDNTLTSFKTDVLMTPLVGCSGGFVNIEKVQGKTEVINGKLVSVGEPVVLDANLFNASYITTGQVYDSNGVIYGESTSSLSTQYINIDNTKEYWSSKPVMIVTYDSNKNFIERLYGGGTDTIHKLKSNVSYIRISQYQKGTTYLNDLKFSEVAYKVEILSQGGKNLFDKSTTVKGYYYYLDGSNYASSTSSLGTQFIQVDNAKTYYSNKEVMVITYDTNKNFIERLYNGAGKTTHTFSSNVKYIRISQYEKGLTYLDDLILSETQGLSYEQYKEDKAEILTTQPLREWDSIESKSVVNRGSCQIVINGDGLTNVFNSNNVYKAEFQNWVLNKNIYCLNDMAIGKAISSDFFYTITSNSSTDDVGISVYDSDKSLYVRVLKTKIDAMQGSTIKEKFTSYLNTSPISFAYKLATPTTENLNKTLDLRAYDNLVVNSGAIQPTVSYSYAKNTGERITSIEDTVENVKDKVDSINYNVEYNLTPLNGMQTYSNTPSKVIKQGNICTVMISLDATNMQDFTKYGLAYLMLPEDCKPQNYIGDFYISTSTGISTVVLTKEGKISRGNIIPATKPTWICGIFNYVI